MFSFAPCCEASHEAEPECLFPQRRIKLIMGHGPKSGSFGLKTHDLNLMTISGPPLSTLINAGFGFDGHPLRIPDRPCAYKYML